MAKTYITHACGHEVTVQLYGKSSERDRKQAWLEQQECRECQAKAEAAKNGSTEVEMSYREYKTDYYDCKTKPNSYDKDNKTIIVYVPAASTERDTEAVNRVADEILAEVLPQANGNQEQIDYATTTIDTARKALLNAMRDADPRDVADHDGNRIETAAFNLRLTPTGKDLTKQERIIVKAIATKIDNERA